jgi:hypothetical protein
MKIKIDCYPVSVSQRLATILESIIDSSGITGGIIINLRDPGYSAEAGGFHPVEIAVSKNGTLLYITDFTFVGSGPFVELAKEIDYDFQNNVFGHMGIDYPMREGRQLFRVFQDNLCDYYEMGVFSVECSEL